MPHQDVDYTREAYCVQWSDLEDQQRFSPVAYRLWEFGSEAKVIPAHGNKNAVVRAIGMGEAITSE